MPISGMQFLASVLIAARLVTPATDSPPELTVRLTEWKVELSAPSIAPGTTRILVTNDGSIPHGVEIEGRGVERRIALIQPGVTDTLTLSLKAGRYEIYCPIGDGSHKKLGMEVDLAVGTAGTGAGRMERAGGSGRHSVSSISVTGGGPVVQILPGPFPFPDSAAPILAQFGDEKEGLESQVKNGPYSNNVATIQGSFRFTAWDLGSVRDSVDGVAEFTVQDGAKWRMVMDRVQTKDVPHHPRFGGVILGLYYHGNTMVHTPLVPTINSAVALWAFAHLYRNGVLVTDDAMVHVMLLSHTRNESDFALACWDCSKNRIDELQLQILPGVGEPRFDAPGGFLFVNWEKSRGVRHAG